MRLNVIKKVIFIFFASFHLSIAFSQTVLLDVPEIYIGTSQGASVSYVYFNPWLNQYPFLGYNGGVSFKYVTEKHFGLQAELNYSQRGWKERSSGYTRRVNYIEMPFLTHLYTGNTNRFIFNLGPKISYKLSEHVLQTASQEPDAEQHKKPVYRSFDYGLCAGLGYGLKLAKVGLIEAELRAYYGLSNIFADSKSDYFQTSNYLYGSFNLAWYFQLSGKNSN